MWLKLRSIPPLRLDIGDGQDPAFLLLKVIHHHCATPPAEDWILKHLVRPLRQELL